MHKNIYINGMNGPSGGVLNPNLKSKGGQTLSLFCKEDEYIKYAFALFK